MVKKVRKKGKKPVKALSQREAHNAAKAISDPDSPWILTQELLQEVEASFIVSNPNIKHEVPDLVAALKQVIDDRYEDGDEKKQILLDSIPSDRSIRAWRKKDGWEDAVWSLIHGTGLFTAAKRAEMIESLFERGLTKSDNAAKMWLTMSGDYSDKIEVNENALDKFREINKILHGKKRDE